MDTNMLQNMLVDINRHKRKKGTLLEYYVQKRLNLSLESYYADLMQDYNLLVNRDAKKVLKNMNKGNI